MKRLALLLLLLALAGCTSRQAEVDIAASAAVIYHAAGSLPPSAQTQAIRANALAIGHAVGHDIEARP